MTDSTNKTPLRAAIYARLSQARDKEDDATESDSITTQVKDLKKLAKREGFDVIDEDFTDDGVSGYSGKHRQGFQKLMTAIADGRVDVILARHADRLERNESEGFQLRIASVKHKVRWMFSSGMSIDPATAEGGLLAKILSALSEFESKVKTQRLLAHYDGKRTSGTFQAPSGTFGYDKADTVPEEAARIREAYDAIDAGKSVGSIVSLWNRDKVPQRRGGQGWTYSHLTAILKRPRNAALVAELDGSIIAGLVGQWEPIVSVELWQRVNHILSDPSRTTTTGNKPTHMSGGFARCGICGMAMRSNTVTDTRRGTRYKIVRCPSLAKDGVRHPSGRVEEMDALIRAEIIKAFAFGPSELFEDGGAQDALAIQRDLASLRATREDILNLLELGAITKAEAVPRLKRSEVPIALLQERLEQATSASASASMLVDLRRGVRDPESRRASMAGMAILKKELGVRFDALDIEQKRKLASNLLDLRVMGGRGADKYQITHTKVLHLNE